MKERLVGAAVLVAIGAWLIPWVLDGPEQISEPAATALDLPVPSAENPPVRTETVRLDRRESPPASPPQAMSSASPVTAPSEDSSTTASTASEAVPAPAVAAEPEPAVAAEPEPPSVVQDSNDEGGWYIQIGAFGDQSNAERQAARVDTFGYDAHVSTAPSGGRVVHRVRIGPQSTRERAEAIASSLSAHGFVAQVVPQ